MVKGDAELTRKLINQCRNKNKYTSAVLSFERMISKTDEKEIIRRFEKVAFAGLRDHQFQCLWIRHSHLGRSELHFLVPKNELTSLKALNIDPPRLRQEGLYDSFRKLINHEFSLKDPTGAKLSRAEHTRLTEKLAKLVAGRAAYNRRRYPVVGREQIQIHVPARQQDRTGPADRSTATPGSGLSTPQPATRPTVEHLDRATRTFGQTCQHLDAASNELGRATGAIQQRLVKSLARRRRVAVSKSLFTRYAIPESQPAMTLHDVDRGELILELGKDKL